MGATEEALLLEASDLAHVFGESFSEMLRKKLESTVERRVLAVALAFHASKLTAMARGYWPEVLSGSVGEGARPLPGQVGGGLRRVPRRPGRRGVRGLMVGVDRQMVVVEIRVDPEGLVPINLTVSREDGMKTQMVFTLLCRASSALLGLVCRRIVAPGIAVADPQVLAFLVKQAQRAAAGPIELLDAEPTVGAG